MSLTQAHLKQAETLGRIMSLYGKQIEVTQFEDLKKSLTENDKIYSEDVIKSYITDVNLNAQRNPDKSEQILKSAHNELVSLKKVEVIEEGKLATYYIKKGKEVEGSADDMKEDEQEKEGTEKNDEEREEQEEIADADKKKDKLEKGEGSRGGHVIGHTRSGKPIYENFNHHSHSSFTKEDHKDAAQHHEEHLRDMHDQYTDDALERKGNIRDKYRNHDSSREKHHSASLK